jgi:glycosyltransferase involved in cell wall biosynthesis
MANKILFISHDATRTGAPFVLLHLLRWAKKNTDIEFEILLKNGGDLEKEFADVAETHIWNKGEKTGNKFEKILLKIKLFLTPKNNHQAELLDKLKEKKFSLVFANSIASSDVAIELKKNLNIPVLLYIHELEISIRQYCGLEIFNEAKKYLDYFIGSSRMVFENLKFNHNIPEQKMDLVFDYIPAKEYHDQMINFDREGVREKLGMQEESFIIGSCGTLDWRKGVDLIPQIASLVEKKTQLPVSFVWFGGHQEGIDFEKILYDVEKLGVNNKVIFTDYALPEFSAIDAFLLSSREDPFPLVCLEAASLEKPIICFESAGGMPDFVDKNCGFVIPYLDTEMVAEKIIELAKNRPLAEKLGKNAAQKVISNHDVNIAGKQILDVVDKVLKLGKKLG